MFSNQFNMEIDNETLFLDTEIFNDGKLFDEALDFSEELAEQTANGAVYKLEAFTDNLKKQYKGGEVSLEVAKDFYQIYQGLKKVKEAGRDSIWKFIVQNLYKPYFLANKFDYIVGNPPWFTFSSIRNESYQDTLDALAQEYDVKPVSAKNYPNLEIAAIFLAYCSSYFLKHGGQIAFVLPRSFFSADHHDNTRRGESEGFVLKQLWDLEKVSPLFRVPSCVLFGEKFTVSEGEKEKEALKQSRFNQYTQSGIAGKEFSGALSVHNCNWNYADELLTVKDEIYFYLKQGNSSAFSKRQTSNQRDNPYKKLFKRGAEITPRTFYFVELNQGALPDYEDRIINVKTAEDILPDAKMPWKSFAFSDRIESRFLFRTALSKSILPFFLFEPNLIVLPAIIETDNMGHKAIKLRSSKDLLNEGFLHASRWFNKAEDLWNENRTEKNKDISAVNYLNWNEKITSQPIDIPYLVTYNASAKDANAVVIDRNDIDFEIIIDTVTYAFYTSNLNEAHYLTAILNSATPNEMMKDFQARGLFGARHVHKKIVDIYYPRFDSTDDTHIALAELSKQAHAKASEYLKINPPQGDLTPMKLGKIRLEIKRYLHEEMKKIDELVDQIIA